MNPITWTLPHGRPSEGRITRFLGTAYDGRIEVEMVGSAPDGWCALMYWRGSPVPAVPVMRWIGQRLDRVAKGVL